MLSASIISSCSSNDDDNNDGTPSGPISFKIDGVPVVFAAEDIVVTHGNGNEYNLMAEDQASNYLYFNFSSNDMNMDIDTFHYDPVGELDYFEVGLDGIDTEVEINTAGHLKGTFSGQVYYIDEDGNPIVENVTDGKLDVNYTPN